MSSYSSFLEVLENFQPKDANEVAVFERLVQFSRESGGSIYGTEIAENLGHVTAQARIENQAGTHVLLVFGSKEGRWKYPGGHIEANVLETAITEASRALNGEISDNDSSIFSLQERQIPEYWNTPEHIHFEITFRFVTDEEGDLPQGAKWFTQEEANALLCELL